MKYTVLSFIIFGLAVVNAACTYEFVRDIYPVISSRATGHTGGTVSGNLNFGATAQSAYAAIYKVASFEVPATLYATTGRNSSYIYQKISLATPPVGSQMPLGGPYLNAATIEMFGVWLDEGAIYSCSTTPSTAQATTAPKSAGSNFGPIFLFAAFLVLLAF